MNLDQTISARRMPREEVEAAQRLIEHRERQIGRVRHRAECQAREGLDFWTWATLEEAPAQDRRHFFEARAHSLAQAEVERLQAEIEQLKEARREPLARFAWQEACPGGFFLLLGCLVDHPHHELIEQMPQFYTVRGVARHVRALTLEKRALPQQASATQPPVRMLLLREVGEIRGGSYHHFTFQNPAHPTR